MEKKLVSWWIILKSLTHTWLRCFQWRDVGLMSWRCLNKVWTWADFVMSQDFWEMLRRVNVFCMWDMNSYRQRADWQIVFTKDDHHNIPYPAGFSQDKNDDEAIILFIKRREGLWFFQSGWTSEYGRSNNIWLLKLSHKRQQSLFEIFTLKSQPPCAEEF